MLIGGDPSELQPLTGKQMRQAVRNGGATLVLINSVPIRLREQAKVFLHIRPGTEDAIVLALAGSSNDSLAAQKAGVEASAIDAARQAIANTEGDVVMMFGHELSECGTGSHRSVVADVWRRRPANTAASVAVLQQQRRRARHGNDGPPTSPGQILDAAGSEIRALYMAGSFLPEHFKGREDALSQLDFLVVQELFENETTATADVVLPAASYAEQDGTFTNNDGFVQRVRQSIPPLHQSKPDWMITAQLAKELGMDFGYEMSASAVFREIGEKVPAFAGMRYPLLKDETNPVQAKYQEVGSSDVSGNSDCAFEIMLNRCRMTGDKITVTPEVGTELFRLGR